MGLCLCMQPLILTVPLSGRYYKLHFQMKKLQLWNFPKFKWFITPWLKKKKGPTPKFSPYRMSALSTIPVQELHN